MKKILLSGLLFIPSVLWAGPDPRGILELEGWGNSDAAGITSKRGRNDFTIKEPVTSGDSLFFIKGFGYNGSDFTGTPRAQISFNAAETWTSTNNGADIRFSITPNASTTMSEKVRISTNGYVGIGTTNPTVALDVSGSAKVSGTITYTPNSTYALFASSTIAYANTYTVIGSSGGAITLTSTPNIATSGVSAGSFIILRSTGPVVTLQDNSTLASSAVEISGATSLTITSDTARGFIFDGTNWVYMKQP